VPTARDLTRAALWMGLYALLALFPLLLLLAAPARWSGGFAEELASALGFLAISLMAMQFLLTARFQWIAPPFGADLVYAFHRHVTWVALAFALAHPVLLFGSSLRDALHYLVPWAAPWEIAAGTWATWALLALAFTSFLRRRLRLPYEPWRRAHGLLAAVVVLFACGTPPGPAASSPARWSAGSGWPGRSGGWPSSCACASSSRWRCAASPGR